MTSANVSELTARAGRLFAEKRFVEVEALLLAALDPTGAGAAGSDDVELLKLLGRVYQAAGKLTDAEAAYRQALDLVRRGDPDHDSEAAKLLHNIAVVCEATGRIGEARTLWAEARAIVDFDGTRAVATPE
jgi:tetratricopeptide (TPR) repeat protein